ncbi:MAG: hypothetical protein IKK13_01445 [Clostridia bacterium]|nr:hypothetical protein [Clostridia bacterium]
MGAKAQVRWYVVLHVMNKDNYIQLLREVDEAMALVAGWDRMIYHELFFHISKNNPDSVTGQINGHITRYIYKEDVVKLVCRLLKIFRENFGLCRGDYAITVYNYTGDIDDLTSLQIDCGVVKIDTDTVTITGLTDDEEFPPF